MSWRPGADLPYSSFTASVGTIRSGTRRSNALRVLPRHRDRHTRPWRDRQARRALRHRYVRTRLCGVGGRTRSHRRLRHWAIAGRDDRSKNDAGPARPRVCACADFNIMQIRPVVARQYGGPDRRDGECWPRSRRRHRGRKHLFPGLRAANGAALKRFIAWRSAMPTAPLNSATRALYDFNLSDDLPRIAVPTLVVAGQEDVLTRPKAMEEIAALIPGAELSAHSQRWSHDPGRATRAVGRAPRRIS